MSLLHLLKYGTLFLHLYAPATALTLSTGTSKLTTSSKPFHCLVTSLLAPLITAFADIVRSCKFHYLH